MRISDWSSDVCSSDLRRARVRQTRRGAVRRQARAAAGECRRLPVAGNRGSERGPDRKSVVSGKSVSVRVDLGGRRIINQKTIQIIIYLLSQTNDHLATP